MHFTRSRAYRKNDNARVEGKNWTEVLQLVGYGRLKARELRELLLIAVVPRPRWSEEVPATVECRSPQGETHRESRGRR